ncbi:MAG TPA: multiheme c-type cytochrome [Candidatus Eisenbacteria bacterium]
MKLPEQVTRIGVVTGILVAVVLVLRFVVIPASYFSRSLHESATVTRETARTVSFAGSAACVDCHADEVETKARGYHKGLACETCHGPSQAHVEDPTSVKPYAPRDRKFCPVCHQYDSARPTGFPQINPTVHNPLKPCITCHQPHDPVPPHVPQECSACHAQIERTKAVSAHALLPCVTCHTVSQQHKITPRAALPTKPQTREFCGQCHATGAANPDAPKIDLATHGGSYLCWQCHYPHLPEGR